MARFIVDVANVESEDIKNINIAITNGIEDNTSYGIITANCIDETNDNQFMEFEDDNYLSAEQILNTFTNSSDLSNTLTEIEHIIKKFKEFKSNPIMSDKKDKIVNKRFDNIGHLENELYVVFGFPVKITSEIVKDENSDDEVGDDELQAVLNLVGMTAGDLTLYYVKDRRGKYLITEMIHS